MDHEAKCEQTAMGDDDCMPSWREVFFYFLMLGFVNIGGPVAQITMMYNHMVEKRHWLSKDRFLQIMAFCHMLPGPEALQLAIYVGYLKRRVWGGVLAGSFRSHPVVPYSSLRSCSKCSRRTWSIRSGTSLRRRLTTSSNRVASISL